MKSGLRRSRIGVGAQILVLVTVVVWIIERSWYIWSSFKAGETEIFHVTDERVCLICSRSFAQNIWSYEDLYWRQYFDAVHNNAFGTIPSRWLQMTCTLQCVNKMSGRYVGCYLACGVVRSPYDNDTVERHAKSEAGSLRVFRWPCASYQMLIVWDYTFGLLSVVPSGFRVFLKRTMITSSFVATLKRKVVEALVNVTVWTFIQASIPVRSSQYKEKFTVNLLKLVLHQIGLNVRPLINYDLCSRVEDCDLRKEELSERSFCRAMLRRLQAD